MRYLLGVDIGTSGTKTVLFDETGVALASATGEYGMAQPRNGWAEQDPADWWHACRDTIAAVIAKSGVPAREIVGVGLSGQMHGLVMLDKSGAVIRPSLIWCDQRTAAQAAEIAEKVGVERLMAITCNQPQTAFTAAKLLWVRENEPEHYARCAHVLLPKDYIRFMLTGEFATEVSDAGGMQLLDVPNRRWSDEILRKLEIDGALLGRVYESPEITGVVTARAAEATGLCAGTPVVGGAGDNAAAAVGMGVVRTGRAFTTIGTSGVVFAHQDTPATDPRGRAHTLCAAVPGAWHVMGVTQCAGLSLRWFRDTFCEAEIAEAARTGRDAYTLMTDRAARAPIGANRLLFLPYLMGERTPHLDPYARGVFFGLSPIHTKDDMLRAVLEGITYALTDSVTVVRELGITPARMAVCGGGGRSPFWRQMLADVFGCPVVTTKQTEGPALGVALLAAVGAGVYASVPEACDAVIGVDTTCEPDAARGEAYARAYGVYDALYPLMKDGFRALETI